MLIVLSVIIFLYLGVILLLRTGFRKALARSTNKDNGTRPFVSVLLPARNEAAHIALLIEDLRCQSCSGFELIVIDDHSTDETPHIVQSAIANFPNARYHRLVHEYGKKAALTAGVSLASGEIVLTVDADCRAGSRWIEAMVAAFSDPQIHFVFGPVSVINSGFWSAVEAIDSASLVGTGAATAALGLPGMCNGANLGFRKSTFQRVNGYADNLHYPSGDDEFLIRKVHGNFPGSIRFIANPEALIKTYPQPSLTKFLQQRLRWAGKWRLHGQLRDRLPALFIFLFHLTVLTIPFLAFVGIISWPVGVAFYFLRGAADYCYLRPVVGFLKVNWRRPAFLFMETVYPFYAVGIGILSLFAPFTWKGRKLKPVMRYRVTLQDYERTVAKEQV